MSYIVWQVSCHTFVTLIIHTCLIITDTIGIHQRIVTIIHEWSTMITLASQLTPTGVHWPGVIPRLRNAPPAHQGQNGTRRGESRPDSQFSVKKLCPFFNLLIIVFRSSNISLLYESFVRFGYMTVTFKTSSHLLSHVSTTINKVLLHFFPQFNAFCWSGSHWILNYPTKFMENIQ